MSKVPSLDYRQVINALKRDGWVVVRQKGSHIRLHKHTADDMLKITYPLTNRSNDQLCRISSSTQA